MASSQPGVLRPSKLPFALSAHDWTSADTCLTYAETQSQRWRHHCFLLMTLTALSMMLFFLFLPPSFVHSLFICETCLGSSPDQHKAGRRNEPLTSCGKEDHEEREPPTVGKKNQNISPSLFQCLSVKKMQFSLYAMRVWPLLVTTDIAPAWSWKVNTFSLKVVLKMYLKVHLHNFLWLCLIYMK